MSRLTTYAQVLMSAICDTRSSALKAIGHAARFDRQDDVFWSDEDSLVWVAVEGVCSRYGLEARMLPDGVVFTCRGDRSNRPATVIVSDSATAHPSPRAELSFTFGRLAVQLTERGVDDAGLEGDRPEFAGRYETQGRVLFY